MRDCCLLFNVRRLEEVVGQIISSLSNFRIEIIIFLQNMFQANMSQAPLDNFKFMAAENICTSRPNFYVTWAWELEQAENFKGAEKVKGEIICVLTFNYPA